MSDYQKHLHNLDSGSSIYWTTLTRLDQSIKEYMIEALSRNRKIYDLLWRELSREGPYSNSDFRDVYMNGWDYSEKTKALKVEFQIFTSETGFENTSLEDFL